MVDFFHTFYKGWQAWLAVVLYGVLLTWWIWLHSTGASDDALLLWGTVYQIVAWYGAILGFIISKEWGGLKSWVGRAMFAFSLGLLCQAFGQSAYAWYVFYLHLDIPYPSIGDLGYFGSIPFYIYAAFMLAKVSGAKVSLKSYQNQILAFIIPLLMLALSYFIFLRGYEFDWAQPLKTFLDFGYPFGQAIYVSIAILAYLLSRKTLVLCHQAINDLLWVAIF